MTFKKLMNTKKKLSDSRSLILVLGMHRSGTSAITRVLNIAGSVLPPDLMEASPENEAGYWESKEVVAANDAFFESLGMAYHSISPMPDGFETMAEASTLRERIHNLLEQTPHQKSLLIKDPRISRLLPIWKAVAREADHDIKIVFMLRNPLEVMDSLDLRGNISPEKAGFSWLQHNLEAEYHSRGLPRVFVGYSKLLDDWRSQLKRIQTALGEFIPGPDAEAAALIDSFLQAGLRHHAHSDRELVWDPRSNRWIEEAYQALSEACRDEPTVSAEYIDRIRVECCCTMDVVSHVVERKDAQIAAVVADRAKADISRQRDGAPASASGEHLLGLLQKSTASIERLVAAVEGEQREKERMAAEFVSWKSAAAAERLKEQEKSAELEKLYTAAVAELKEMSATSRAALDAETGWRLEWERRAEWLGQMWRERAGGRIARLLRRFGPPGKILMMAAGLYGGPRILNLRRLLSLARQRRAILRSSFFDGTYYLENNWDVWATGQDPALHYLLSGADEERNPGPEFETGFYLKAYSDVRAAGVNPLYHYISAGEREGRLIRSPKEGPGAAAEGGPFSIRPDDPALEEARRGETFLKRFDLLSPNPDFDAAVFALRSADQILPVAKEGVAPDVSIIIPVYGQLAYTLNCLASLRAHESRFCAEVIVVDDCSLDETRAYLRKLDWIKRVEREKNGGFIAACNAGAAAAAGRFVVFLNNDTRVAPGWLDELIGTFDLQPEAGLVGSKLLYPDGALQEAGAIVWRDGSAWNYGRDQDPGQPHFCYARQVDYCSGAALALPKELWNSLEGFDAKTFERSYCEDCDLAFRVREAGKQVWYQPLSRVIHYEGKTGGTDTAAGEKAYQLSNQKRLFERWQSVMAGHAENGMHPYREADRHAKRVALVVDACSPEPWADAGSVVALNTMRALQKLGYRVAFAPQTNMLFMRRCADLLQRMGIEVLYYPYYDSVLEYLERHGDMVDLVHLTRYEVAANEIDNVRRLVPHAHIAFNVADLHHVRLRRQGIITGDEALVRRADTEVKDKELDVICRVDTAFVHTEVERQIVLAERPNANVHVFPYVVDEFGRASDYESRSGVMFLGGYAHTPNVDAAVFFAEEVMPHLRRLLPGVKFHVAGSKVTERVKGLAAEDVIIDGYVPDLGEYFSRFRVFVAPLRYGAGIKGKVASALAYGMPSVISTIAAEGMDLDDGVHAVIRDDAEEIAASVAKLYQNSERWQAMSDAALGFSLDHYSLDAACAAFENALALKQAEQEKLKSA